MKTKLHIHSDNPEWAGCENMPGIFLQDELLNSKFDISFSYRYTIEYFTSMKNWIKTDNKIYPLFFLTSFLYRLRKHFKPVMALKYLTMLHELWVLYKLFKKTCPDILHVNNGGYFGATSCNSAAIAARLTGIKKITYMINSVTKNKWYEKPITYFIKKYVTCFITASRTLKINSDFLWEPKYDSDSYYKSSIKNKIYLKTDNFIVIPNTIKYRNILTREHVRNRFKCIENEIVFLCVGKYERRKGFDIAIDTFDRLDEIGTARSIIIAGSGPMREELIYFSNKMEKLIYIYDKTDNVVKNLIGDIDDYSLINACDVLIVPSIKNEDFPNVILIAMMYGKPIIASDVGGISKMVSKDCGFVIDSGYPDKLSRAMNVLMTNSDLRQSMGEASSSRFIEKYSSNQIITRYINLWDSL